MFGDIGWTEMLLIGIVALIVIGPEDLPQMFRQIGRFTAKIRAMSRDFSRAMEQAAQESGVKDVAKDLRAATSVGGLGLDKVKAAADRFEKWDPIKPKTATKPVVPPAVPVKPVAQATPDITAEPVAQASPDIPTEPVAQVTPVNTTEPVAPPKMAKPRAPRKKKEISPE